MADIKLNSIEDAVKDFQEGKFVIVVDDEDRENEGDLIIAAEKIDAEKVNFMLKNARGVLCAPITLSRCEELDLPHQVSDNTSMLGTPFTVTVDKLEGCSTGVSAHDRAETIKALATQFPKQGKHDAILIMAHGTPQVSNAYYSVIQAKIDELGYKNVFVYTVEGWPSLETVLPKLKANGIRHVTLMPMMMVAGDHANNDMAGAEPDSHKSILEAAGYKVDAYIHGIGENPAIQAVYLERANDAWNALESK